MQSRPVVKRGSSEYKYFSVGQWIFRQNEKAKLMWVGIANGHDPFELTNYSFLSPNWKITTAAAKEMAPHLFK